MIKFNTIKNYIAPRARLFRKELKQSFNEAKEINREDNVFKRISTEVQDTYKEVKNLYTRGEVSTEGVTDDKAKNILDNSKKGLEAYAKANKINIIFHTPQKPYECGSKAFENPLTISVDSKKGIFSSWQMEEKTINGDTNEITKHLTEKQVKSGDKFISVSSEKDETFLRRVYRTVSELKNQITK